MLDHSTILDIEICHPLFKDNVQLLVPPDSEGLHSTAFREILSKGVEKVLPVFLYAVGEDSLTDQVCWLVALFQNVKQFNINLMVFIGQSSFMLSCV
jgi:hypothetical protein